MHPGRKQTARLITRQPRVAEIHQLLNLTPSASCLPFFCGLFLMKSLWLAPFLFHQ